MSTEGVAPKFEKRAEAAATWWAERLIDPAQRRPFHHELRAIVLRELTRLDTDGKEPFWAILRLEPGFSCGTYLREAIGRIATIDPKALSPEGEFFPPRHRMSIYIDRIEAKAGRAAPWTTIWGRPQGSHR